MSHSSTHRLTVADTTRHLQPVSALAPLRESIFRLPAPFCTSQADVSNPSPLVPPVTAPSATTECSSPCTCPGTATSRVTVADSRLSCSANSASNPMEYTAFRISPAPKNWVSGKAMQVVTWLPSALAHLASPCIPAPAYALPRCCTFPNSQTGVSAAAACTPWRMLPGIFGSMLLKHSSVAFGAVLHSSHSPTTSTMMEPNPPAYNSLS